MARPSGDEEGGNEGEWSWNGHPGPFPTFISPPATDALVIHVPLFFGTSMATCAARSSVALQPSRFATRDTRPREKKKRAVSRSLDKLSSLQAMRQFRGETAPEQSPGSFDSSVLAQPAQTSSFRPPRSQKSTADTRRIAKKYPFWWFLYAKVQGRES